MVGAGAGLTSGQNAVGLYSAAAWGSIGLLPSSITMSANTLNSTAYWAALS